MKVGCHCCAQSAQSGNISFFIACNYTTFILLPYTLLTVDLYLPRQPLPRLQPPFSKLRADAAPAPAQFCRPHRALYSTRHSRPEARHNPMEPTEASLLPHLRPSATWPTVESRRRLQCHRTASPSPSRRSATPFLFTTGVSGTVPGRRQPPAMPQGAPAGGAPMGHRHHS